MKTSRPAATTWPLLASGVSLIAVCYGMARFAYGLFVPAFRAELGLNDALLGTIAAGSYLGYCAAIVASAIAVPRYGARAVAASAGVLAAAGMLLVATAASGAMLAAGVLVAGTSTGAASPPLVEAVTRVVPRPRRDGAHAVVNGGTGAGIALSGPVAILAAGNWRLAWVAFAAVAVAVTWWVVLAIPPRAKQPQIARLPQTQPAEQPRWATDLARLAADRLSWPLAAGAALMGVASSGVWTFGRDHLNGSAQLTEDVADLLWIALGVAGLVGVTTGYLSRRWGLGRVWRGSLLLLAAASAALGLPGFPVPRAAAALTMFGGAYIVLTAVIMLWAIRLFPDRTAAAVAFGFLLLALGQAFAAPAAGALAGQFGTSTALLVVATVGAVAGLIGPAPQPPDSPARHTGRSSSAGRERQPARPQAPGA